MKHLVIVESPAKAKTIEKYLGKDYTVKASVGHIRDLPKSNKNAIDIEAGFVPHYEIVATKRPVISDLKKAASKVDEVILATDPDREGEAIAWHVAEALGLKDPKRIVFNEITKEAVQEALRHPRAIDVNLLRAQEARRVLDRLVGYDLSGLIWKKVRYGLSAGRVQSPALRIIMEREREIRAFIPETFWTIEAAVQSTSNTDFVVTCALEPRDEAEKDRIVTAAENGSWSVADIKESDRKRKARPPFTTSTLQQAASSRLGFAPSRTMRVAQRLYEAGHITYMRTDSTNLAEQAQKQAAGVITKEYGADYVEIKNYSSKSKNAQEAHEAIRPTDLSKLEAGANEEQQRLYDLIWARTVASQMVSAQIKQTRIEATTGDNSIPLFKVSGSRVITPGWLKADPAARGEDIELPLVTIGERLIKKNVHPIERETTPPPRYSEAGLVKELEKRGIGRPSTYAATIKNIEDRGYVTKEGRTLTPTDTGDVVSSFLEDYFSDYISDSFTSDMENELDDIALGARDYAKTLTEFYAPFSKDVETKDKEAAKITDLGPAPTEWDCPKCGKEMNYKLGRAGKFVSCSNFPECDGARTKDGEPIKDPESLGEDPETGEHIYILEGPYGPYVQLGQKPAKGSRKQKPKRASIPPEMDANDVTLADAIKLLSLPRVLGTHPETGKEISASIGRFGPFIVHDGDFRSIKEDDPYTIELPRALTILAEPKRGRRGVEVVKELGKHPKSGKMVNVYKSKSGVHVKKGLKNVYLPTDVDLDKFELTDALELIKNTN